ncbi:sugar phosphate nucleotidyltransferase [Bythopirellula polymerisocia]|uniref:Bifunctional protein GlmU n=1 Tax=Bythopirellula polymerisocia TaxID=2528003 RepID=A0A5C6CU62_9BACT|nr:NTP transferase domain-containing protein [Bythopirellula polymerisocia]TWU28503.1 Bifunctional protein GlmU [Bythopirellula polymerisocia]
MPKNLPENTTLAIVLAAGKGTRMESELPKVLVPVAGRPMIRYVIDAIHSAGVGRILVVVGYRAELVRAELSTEPKIEFAEQHEQLGTGHAVMMCRDQLSQHQGPVLIVAGDSPLLQAESISRLLENFSAADCDCVIGTVDKENPIGYGRIVRNQAGEFVGIVEEKDASPDQRELCEVNVSTYLFDSQALLFALNQLTDENAQKEYYITDCPAVLFAAGKRVMAEKVLQPCESMSINNRDELALVEAAIQSMSPSN